MIYITEKDALKSDSDRSLKSFSNRLRERISSDQVDLDALKVALDEEVRGLIVFSGEVQKLTEETLKDADEVGENLPNSFKPTIEKIKDVLKDVTDDMKDDIEKVNKLGMCLSACQDCQTSTDNCVSADTEICGNDYYKWSCQNCDLCEQGYSPICAQTGQCGRSHQPNPGCTGCNTTQTGCTLCNIGQGDSICVVCISGNDFCVIPYSSTTAEPAVCIDGSNTCLACDDGSFTSACTNCFSTTYTSCTSEQLTCNYDPGCDNCQGGFTICTTGNMVCSRCDGGSQDCDNCNTCQGYGEACTSEQQHECGGSYGDLPPGECFTCETTYNICTTTYTVTCDSNNTCRILYSGSCPTNWVSCGSGQTYCQGEFYACLTGNWDTRLNCSSNYQGCNFSQATNCPSNYTYSVTGGNTANCEASFHYGEYENFGNPTECSNYYSFCVIDYNTETGCTRGYTSCLGTFDGFNSNDWVGNCSESYSYVNGTGTTADCNGTYTATVDFENGWTCTGTYTEGRIDQPDVTLCRGTYSNYGDVGCLGDYAAILGCSTSYDYSHVCPACYTSFYDLCSGCYGSAYACSGCYGQAQCTSCVDTQACGSSQTVISCNNCDTGQCSSDVNGREGITDYVCNGCYSSCEDYGNTSNCFNYDPVTGQWGCTPCDSCDSCNLCESCHGCEQCDSSQSEQCGDCVGGQSCDSCVGGEGCGDCVSGQSTCTSCHGSCESGNSGCSSSFCAYTPPTPCSESSCTSSYQSGCGGCQSRCQGGQCGATYNVPCAGSCYADYTCQTCVSCFNSYCGGCVINYCPVCVGQYTPSCTRCVSGGFSCAQCYGTVYSPGPSCNSGYCPICVSGLGG